MARNFNLAIDEYYHVYNRGTDRRTIFTNPNDWHRFLKLLYVANSKKTIHLSDYEGSDLSDILVLDRGETLTDIGCYCLMPNHFHLLLKEKEENGISLFMQKILTGYTMYFNKRFNRRGALFESTFNAQHASEDRYLKYLFAYIHLNPVKIIDPINWDQKIIPNPEQAKKFLSDYRFSSYQHYLGASRPEDVILNRAVFPDYFQQPGEFANWVQDWMSFTDE